MKAGRSHYNNMVQTSKVACKDVTSLGKVDNVDNVHYSFDYAQQVHLPSNPMQPGPIYFLVPRKCGIFGVCCEGIPKQVNYIRYNNIVLISCCFFYHYGTVSTTVW